MWLCEVGCMPPKHEAYGYFFPGALKAQVCLMNTKGTSHLRYCTVDVYVYVHPGIDRNTD